MRKLVIHMHTTLDGRISRPDTSFWEPFCWGEEEMAYLNQTFAAADTWAMSRKLYEFVVPYWEQVAAGMAPDEGEPVGPASEEFAQILAELTKLVFSRPLHDDPARQGSFVPATWPQSFGSSRNRRVATSSPRSVPGRLVLWSVSRASSTGTSWWCIPQFWRMGRGSSSRCLVISVCASKSVASSTPEPWCCVTRRCESLEVHGSRAMALAFPMLIVSLDQSNQPQIQLQSRSWAYSDPMSGSIRRAVELSDPGVGGTARG